MQNNVRQWCGDIARTERGLEPLSPSSVIDDFGFWYSVVDVENWYLHLTQFNKYPDPGGYDQQDQRKIQDINTLVSIINEERKYLKAELKTDG